MRIINSFLLISLLGCHSSCFASTSAYFNLIKSDPNKLYAFLKEMPKGGELHYHLAGGAYPETMLEVAAKNSYCLNKETLSLTKPSEQCEGINAKDLDKNPGLYNQTIRAWSMKYFVPGAESGHDHFFNSFIKFMPIVVDHSPELLAEVMQRAANQHELYLEVMILPDNGFSTSFATKPINVEQFADFKKELETNTQFVATIQKTVDEAAKLLEQTRTVLGCNTNDAQPACGVTVKFQYYILREQPLEKVFAQALNGFAAASRSKDIVGINLVQPEDGIISLRDYNKQMQVIDFMHQAYPEVHISLHAGELAPGLVRPDNLRFHIREAIDKGHAERIGHGVDIGFENNAEELIEQMAEEQITAEINLISNKEILNVSGKKHPLNYYLSHNVPVVLSTDDEGILRTDLTSQYLEAALVHQVDYPTLKTINRNALTYSFLPGTSIWQDASKGIALPQCLDLYSQNCKDFIKHNLKARLQRQLEIKLNAFEKLYNYNPNNTNMIKN